MKILYVVTGLGMGGAEKVVINLAERMFKLGNEVKIVCLKNIIDVKPVEDIEIFCLDLNRMSDIFKSSIMYKEILSRFSPDVVHSHMIHANIFSRLHAYSRNYKLICTAHSSNEGGYTRMLAYRLTNFLSDINTNVSDKACQSLIKKGAFPKSKLKTVYNGIDINKFKNLSSDKINDDIIFVSIGRLTQDKDYPNLIKAISLIKNKINENIKFHIVGDGELRSEIENMIKDLGVENNVKVLGKRNDIPEILNKSDFFILSSKNEGLPTVIIEAMACQKYVISTDCGGAAEIMGETGTLIPKQDSLTLANAILNVLSLNEQTLLENNLNARKRIETYFSLDVSLKKWLEIYEK